MKAIADALEPLTLGRPEVFRNLAVFPLHRAGAMHDDYLTLDEALARKLATVSEVSDGGIVPELRFENAADMPVLLMDGDELVGAKQNRVLNLSIMVGAYQSVHIPVSCVERGRWRYTSRHFHSSDRNLYASARAAKMTQVSASLRRSRSRRSDQLSVWDDIAAKSERMQARSDTEAMASLYDSHHEHIAAYQAAFRAADAQVGAVFGINGRIVGVEIFDASVTFQKLLRKLLGSYAMDAIDVSEARNVAPSLAEVANFLDEIKRAAAESFPAVGEGHDVRLNGAGVTGGALIARGRVVHLSAFAEQT
jgi:hypothetical protein